LYAYSNSAEELLDITPFKVARSGTLNSAITTTTGSKIVSIYDSAHGLVSGDYVTLYKDEDYNGVTIAGTYFVDVTTPDDYSITTTGNAATDSGTGGLSLHYSYYGIVLSDPITTTVDSSTVSIAHTAHGAFLGDNVVIDAGEVGGITLLGTYKITSTSDNSYTVDSGTIATSSTTGGGDVSLEYEINIGAVDSGFMAGYSLGAYSAGGYSEASVSSTYVIAPRIWCLDNYGQQLLANPIGGTIYVWDPSTVSSSNGRAYPLYGAPTGVQAMFVTPERFVFALGNTGSYLEVKWPVQTNYTDWMSLPTNTANARTLQIGSYLVGGIPVRDGTSLVLTNNCCYAFNYNGDAYIYDSTSVGKNTGLIGPLAGCSYAGDGFWMGPMEWWTWNGTVSPLPSDDIRDFVYKNITKQQQFKCFAVPYTAKKEVTFYVPLFGSLEPNWAVTWHIDQQCWSIDPKARTSQIDGLLFPNPISVDIDGNVWKEEFGHDADGAAIDAYVTLSPMAISEGDRKCDIMGFMPDFERQTENCYVSVLAQTYPKGEITTFGPYTIGDGTSNPLVDLREGATFVGYKIESNAIGGDFRVGLCQADTNPAGARR